MTKFSEVYNIYSKRKKDFVYEDCYFCENIEDCPHPDVSSEGSLVCPDECKRKKEIILEKKK